MILIALVIIVLINRYFQYKEKKLMRKLQSDISFKEQIDKVAEKVKKLS